MKQLLYWIVVVGVAVAYSLRLFSKYSQWQHHLMRLANAIVLLALAAVIGLIALTALL